MRRTIAYWLNGTYLLLYRIKVRVTMLAVD